MTRAERVISFVERYCLTPEGEHVGKPLVLAEFQKRFIREIYDNPAGTRRAYLSLARKNGKTSLCAAILLAHLVGPEAKLNSQIVSGARSREQAGVLHALASKMVQLSPELSKLVRIIPSGKRLIGLAMNVEYKALAAEAGTTMGLSPVLAILDEVGQVKGPKDDFIEAIETAQGAHREPLLIAISTQAPTDADLFSLWLDDAEKSEDPRIVSHVYAAPNDCKLDDPKAWEAANPGIDVFRSRDDVAEQATQAVRMPSKEPGFRNLTLNLRIDRNSPFISKTVWQANGGDVAEEWGDVAVYAGLDLSATSDLTAFVPVAWIEDAWEVKPTFWLPGQGLAEKSRADRVPYDVWASEGLIETPDSRSIEYEFVAAKLFEFYQRHPRLKVAFDRWGMKYLRPWLLKAGFTEEQIEEVFAEFGQGFASMSPALRDTESALLNQKVRHGNHPVLTMCAANAVVTSDPAGNRKLNKSKAAGRIDGMIGLVMALGIAPLDEPETSIDDWLASLAA